MLPTIIASARGAVNPQDGALGAFCTRRAQAYAIGEAKARRREISADAYLFLYKELVGLAGERTYCWPGLEFLQERLETSSGTLKRWIKELERADLIRRKPRPGGQTSLTYITAYLELDITESAAEPPATGGRSTARASINAMPVERVPPAPSAEGAQPPAPLFFDPEQQIISDHSAGSAAISQTVKTQKFKNRLGGGSGLHRNRHNDSGQARRMRGLLQAEQVLDPDAVREIAAKSAEEIAAISRYLDGQTNIRSRPALFVWLARRDFGAQLLKHQAPPPARPGQDEPVADAVAAAKHAPSQLWAAVQERLRPALDPGEYATWLEPTRLLEIDGDIAVVATPNIFVRDEIERRYKAECVAQLAAVTGRPCSLELVIVTPRAP